MFKFPYTNLHELNLDWILEKVKTLVENNDEFNDKADYAVETADEAKEIAEQASQAVLPDGSVTTAKLADYAVTQNKLAVNAVGNFQLQDGSVTNSKLADNAVNSAKIADEAVTTAKLDDGAVTYAKMEYKNGTMVAHDVDSVVNNFYLNNVASLGGIKIYSFSKKYTNAKSQDLAPNRYHFTSIIFLKYMISQINSHNHFQI